MTDLSKLPDVDPEVPNAARMYDYYLGGSHNFDADRAMAEQVRSAMPWVADLARANRFFLRRAVRYCAAEGIDQFLDLGSGIPTVCNVHEEARVLAPTARVAYVDNEPVTVASADAILGGDPLATVSPGDLREPETVLAAPEVRDLLDLSRPVALLTVAVMHFVPDEDDPAGLLERYRRRLAPGSAHVLSHATADMDAAEMTGVVNVYRSSANPGTLRTHEQVAALFGDAELVEPGLVDVTEWRPEDTVGAEHRGFWAGVARIR